jgi:hypothetical protein
MAELLSGRDSVSVNSKRNTNLGCRNVVVMKEMLLILEIATLLVIEMRLSVLENLIFLYLSWQHYIHLQSVFHTV